MSTEFIETLTLGISEEIRSAFPKITKKESEILESCLSGMKSVRDVLKAIVDFGLQQLRATAIKPRLHTWIDQFISLNHTMTEVSKFIHLSREKLIENFKFFRRNYVAMKPVKHLYNR